MRKAFTTAFPDETDDKAQPASLDDESMWEVDEEVHLQAQGPTVRLSCFAHTLQLVVRDGLKHTRFDIHVHNVQTIIPYWKKINLKFTFGDPSTWVYLRMKF